MSNLTNNFPIHDITESGVIIGDVKGAITLGYKLTLPTIYSLSKKDYELAVEAYRNFIEMLGGNIIVHKQDRYFKEYFSSIETDVKKNKDFIDRATTTHFNERHYLSHECFLFITKTPNLFQSKGKLSSLIDKEQTIYGEREFIDNCEGAVSILEQQYFKVKRISKEELINYTIPSYYNFSRAKEEELKDVSFNDGSIFVGSKNISVHTIENLSQFPTGNINYYSNKGLNQLPISNMNPFSYALAHPHICNQYIYIPDQVEFNLELEKQKKKLLNFSVKGSNDKALKDLNELEVKISELGCQGCYYHFNIMSFDESKMNIEKAVNTQFSLSGFKKKENILSRKDLFLSGIPGNSIQLMSQYEYMTAKISDLEAAVFSILEQNYESTTSPGQGMKLCDRIYGIPYDIDIIRTPKQQGKINNMNQIVLGPPGSGKSYYINYFLWNEYQYGGHIFIIDASYSYKLHCKVRNGIYMEFTKSSKIEFNPYFINITLANAKDILLEEQNKERIIGDYKEGYGILDRYLNIETKEEQVLFIVSNYLEEKTALLISLTINLIKNTGETTTRFEETLLRLLITKYYTKQLFEEKQNYCFDDFYAYAENHLEGILKEANIEKTDFNLSVFLFSLRPYKSSESLGYLLNSRDNRIKELSKQRFVVIDVKAIKNNPILFSVVTLLSMDVYNDKIKNLPIGVSKFLVVDEAWQAIATPEMGMFLKERVKVDRKYNGCPVFITQEPKDFTMSAVIKESIIDTSDIKVFLDMGAYATKFDEIQTLLGLTDKNVAHILSINKNKRKGSFYKEVCICLMQESTVYALETPLELKAVFETDATEVSKIIPTIEEKGIVLAAINYADNIRGEI